LNALLASCSILNYEQCWFCISKTSFDSVDRRLYSHFFLLFSITLHPQLTMQYPYPPSPLDRVVSSSLLPRTPLQVFIRFQRGRQHQRHCLYNAASSRSCIRKWWKEVLLVCRPAELYPITSRQQRSAEWTVSSSVVVALQRAIMRPSDSKIPCPTDLHLTHLTKTGSSLGWSVRAHKSIQMPLIFPWQNSHRRTFPMLRSALVPCRKDDPPNSPRSLWYSSILVKIILEGATDTGTGHISVTTLQPDTMSRYPSTN
jgi:hypothetical protein